MQTTHPSTNSTSEDPGFSLIELLVVIVVLGVLAAVVAFSVSGVNDRGEESACAADHRAMSAAVEAYRATNSTTTIPATGVGPDAYEQTLVNAGIIRDRSVLWNVQGDGSLIAASPDC